MKKKQFMSKLAALTMAAMMGLSAVPASAVSVLAETSISTDTAVKQTIATTEVGTKDTDVTAAVKGMTSVDLSSATKASDVESTLKTSITAEINGKTGQTATISVPDFSPAVAEVKDKDGKTVITAAKDGSLKGTATWTVAGDASKAVGSYYDITITVPFSATWNDDGKTAVSLKTSDTDTTLAAASGTKTTYTNVTKDTDAVDADDLTTLQQQVKDAIEATDTDAKQKAAPSKLDNTAIEGKIKAAVQAATKYEADVTITSGETDATVIGSVTISVPQSDGGFVFETIGFSTDALSARQKKINQAANDVTDALGADSEYTVSTDNPIDKVIAQVLTDKGYTGINVDSYYITKNTATNYGGKFTLAMPEVKDAAGNVTAVKVTADGTFDLGTGATATSLTDEYLKAFKTAIAALAFPMYDDTTADELTSYLNSDQFKVAGKTLKESGISASNIVVNSVSGVAHGKNGTADITLTLTDASGKVVRQSYTDVVAKHSDSAKLKEATDTVAAVAAKVDTSKAQSKTATVALPLSTDSSVKTNTDIAYNASKADTKSVEGLAQKVVKDSLNTVINADAPTAYKKLSIDFGTATYTKDSVVSGTEQYAPVIKITKYTPATSAKEGTAEVEVTFRTINDAWTLNKSTGVAATQTATAKFTLTFRQLKAKATKFIELGQTQYMTLYAVADSKPTTTYSTKTLTATADGNDPITWTSSDPSVAIVDANGKVTAKGLGTATITATNANNADVSDSVAVVVKNNDEYKFVDVQDANKFYFSPVYAAAAKNVTAGTDATHFSPDASVTRAQFITWLYKLAGEPAVTVTGQFTDVPADKWYSNAVYWALENGITAGTTPTTFSLDQVMTRAQAMTFLYKTYGKGQTYNRELALQFTDVSESSPFAEAINWGLNNNITHGYTTTKFGTDDPCTRGQAVTFLAKYL